jgi:hypothetical protein
MLSFLFRLNRLSPAYTVPTFWSADSPLILPDYVDHARLQIRVLPTRE